MTTTPTWKWGGTRYAHDFLEVILCRLWEGRFGKWRTTTKTTETSRDRQRARRRRHDTVNVRDALRGQAIAVVVVQGLPEAPIAGDDRGEGGRGGSIADEMITSLNIKYIHPWSCRRRPPPPLSSRTAAVVSCQQWILQQLAMLPRPFAPWGEGLDYGVRFPPLYSRK
jgi:hypothetical protein